MNSAGDPVDQITAEDVLGQLLALIEAQQGKGRDIPPALLCQSPEARKATRKKGYEQVAKMREHERYLRSARPINPHAFFFEGYP